MQTCWSIVWGFVCKCMPTLSFTYFLTHPLISVFPGIGWKKCLIKICIIYVDFTLFRMPELLCGIARKVERDSNETYFFFNKIYYHTIEINVCIAKILEILINYSTNLGDIFDKRIVKQILRGRRNSARNF